MNLEISKLTKARESKQAQQHHFPLRNNTEVWKSQRIITPLRE